MASDRDTLTDLIVETRNLNYDEIADAIMAAGFRAHDPALLDDSPVWLSKPMRRVVLVKRQELAITGPAVVLFAPIEEATGE